MFVVDIEKLGLTEKESKVYLTSLRLGPATMQNLARKAGIDRGTAYHVAMTLGEKNLFESVEQGAKTYYRTTHPRRLYEYVEEQKRLAEQHFTTMQEVIDDLESLYELGGMAE